MNSTNIPDHATDEQAEAFEEFYRFRVVMFDRFAPEFRFRFLRLASPISTGTEAAAGYLARRFFSECEGDEDGDVFRKGRNLFSILARKLDPIDPASLSERACILALKKQNPISYE